MTHMIEVKVAELSGDLLDCLVATIENPAEKIFHNCDGYTLRWHNKPPAYSTDCSQGGLLLEKHCIELSIGDEGYWANRTCTSRYDDELRRYPGGTMLIAACRAIVAAKLGDTVQVPEELVDGGEV